MSKLITFATNGELIPQKAKTFENEFNSIYTKFQYSAMLNI
jgi:hypothetical protein